jgi:hypothetical protein
MVNTKTDPVVANPPSVGGWTVLFTRKVPAATASDADYISTGCIYDSAYEYICATTGLVSPTANPTAPALLGFLLLGSISPRCLYLPDGVTVLTPITPIWIPSQGNILSIADPDPFLNFAPARMQLQPSGLFETKWTQDMAKDGHWVIARRRRYG